MNTCKVKKSPAISISNFPIMLRQPYFLPKNAMMITVFIFLFVPFATPMITFNFTSFNSTNQEMKLDGNASVDSKSSVVQLTGNMSNTGRATYFQQLQLWDADSGNLTDFTTHFSFVLDSQNQSRYGDGMTFFLAAAELKIPDQQQGGGLGLVSKNQTFNPPYPFVAVEFDTHENEWDPSHDHVGIDIDSIGSAKTVAWCSSIKNGRMNEAWISYNSSSKSLNVDFTGFKGNHTIIQNLNYEVDLKKYLPQWVTFGFSAATGYSFETHELHSWSFSSQTVIKISNPNPKNPNKKIGFLVASIIVVCALLGGVGLVWFILWKKKGKKEEQEDGSIIGLSIEKECEMSIGSKKFSYEELLRATNNFSEEEKLGEGGFGGVYKGFLRGLDYYVAVKRISKDSKQGVKEYASEIKVISRLRHKNLVQIVGWCHEKGELLLVYEYMANGSLDFHLFKEKSMLKWEMRYKIVQDLAFALLYLHEEWEQCVVHRDIKSSNVMLDSNFNAKLGDFGLARFVDHAKGSETTLLAGTLGYMAPECTITGKSSKESDVYSFGIVALEIVCGRKPFDPKAEKSRRLMVEWVWENYGMGKFGDVVDSRLCGEVDEKQLEYLVVVGIWCAHPDFKLRPTIREAIQVLKFEAPLPILPPKMPVPTYCTPPIHTSISSLSLYNGTSTFEDQNNTHSSYSYKTNSSQFTKSSATSASALLLDTS